VLLLKVITESQEAHLAEPKYREIAADLESKIRSGEFAAGERLPSDADLADMYGASRNTVRQAVSFLLTRGVVEKSSGATLARKKIDPFRTVVSAETGFGGFEGAAYASDVQASNRIPKVTTPRVEIQEASGDIATALQLGQGTSVVIRHQERFIDDYLWSMQTSYYPMSFVERGASKLLAVQDIPEGVRQYLDETIGTGEIGSHDTMTVRAPTPGEATAFQLPEDGRIAVFEARQTGIDPHGKTVRVTITIYPSDRNIFSMNTGALAERPHPKGSS
jgi:GntR family transcriptional regulator